MLKRLINFVCSSSKSSSISTVILASSTREVPLITNSTDRAGREEDLTQTQHVDEKGFFEIGDSRKSSVERALNNPPGDDLMVK